MDIPFKVLFRQPEYRQDDSEVWIKNFVTNEQELYQMSDDKIPEVKENKRLSLEFICEDESARFYMDGLDTIPIRFLEIGEDDIAYLAPSDEEMVLYDSDNKTKANPEGYYPFIPGHYRIKVVLNGVSYYSWLKVKPKQITEEQWVSMRDDIEATLNGLAQDLVRKNASLGINSTLPVPIHILRKLYAIKKDFSKWIAAIKSIQSDPRMRIRKEYSLVSEGKAGEIDATSIRYRARHPESKNFIYSPTNVRNYNLPENKWIRKILRFIVRQMNELLDYLEHHKKKVQQEIKKESRYHDEEHYQVRTRKQIVDELKEYERFVVRVRGEAISALRAEWIEEVDDNPPTSIPHVMHMDDRYRCLYQMYRILKNEDFQVTLDDSYDFYWKRTDLLYEIWGFLQLIEGLQHESVGFEVVEGWIFDINPNSKSIQIPFLEQGTAIEFKRGDIRACLVYDETIPFKKDETILTKPFYTGGPHNRPDVRIDLYEKDEFIGSIVVDFKYRPLWFIWNSNKLQASRQTDTMRQLISYRNNLNSPFLYRQAFPNQWQNFRPVNEVWAVYPHHEDNGTPKDPLEDYRIRLTELTPLTEKDGFYASIDDAIEKVIKTYHALRAEFKIRS